MTKRTLPIVALLGAAALCAAEPPTPDADGWYTLFDGKSLEGWKPVASFDCFKAEAGKLVAGGAAMDHLFYEGPVSGGQFRNFELKAEVMTTPGSNSGIFFHTKPQKGALLKGYEAQIDTSHSDPRRTGSLFDVVDVTETKTKDNEWFEYDLLVQGKQIVLKVNGETIVDYTEPANPERSERRKERVLSSGQIALQGHDPKSKVFFRNIRIKLLPD
jgi:hypothetical protein